MTRVNRIDYGTLRKPHMTDDGFMQFDAIATRSGVFEYLNDDGSTRLEYRPPSEVGNKDSLATLGLKPITLRHPMDAEGMSVMVSPENAKLFMKGQLGEEVHLLDAAPDMTDQRGQFVRVVGNVTHRDAIDAVLVDGIQEVSCGYTCDVEFTPGVTPYGEKYDAIQRDIRYNHLAIVERGRAGHAARLRADTSEQITRGGGHTSRQPNTTRGYIMATAKTTKRRSNFDSLIIREDQRDLAQAIRKDMEEIEEVQDAQEEEIKGLEGKIAELMEKGQSYEDMRKDMMAKLADAESKMSGFDGMFKNLDALLKGLAPEKEDEEVEDEIEIEPTMDAAAVQKVVDTIKSRQDAARVKWHKERTTLENVARHLKVDKAADLNDRDLKFAILKADGQEVATDAKESYLQGRIDALESKIEDDAYRKVGTGITSGRNDAAEDVRKSRADAKAKYEASVRNPSSK